jgi:uncharacterized protein YndB with AHSA1/START domain
MSSLVNTDVIKKQVVLRASRARVWRALTNAQEFGAWFGVKLNGQFAPGERIRGAITHQGYDHLTMEMTIETMEPERRFAWRWHPHAIDPSLNYADEPTTLVTFELEDAPGGTRLTVVESGFDGIPASRRAEAFRGNEGGWTHQMESISRYVSANP